MYHLFLRFINAQLQAIFIFILLVKSTPQNEYLISMKENTMTELLMYNEQNEKKKIK